MRTTFAKCFRDAVGRPRLDYLTDWRMRLAADRLRRTSDSVASIAFWVGYESEVAFSTAFRRVMGRAPSRHRQNKSPLIRQYRRSRSVPYVSGARWARN